MNLDDKDTATGTNLELALGNSNQIVDALSNDSGAGANAGLGIEMTFIDTDPMSELVWSPQNGLSLKCANGGFPGKRPSVLWAEGPSKMVNQLSTDNPVVKETYSTSLTVCNTSSEACGRAWYPTSKMPLTGSSNELKTANDGQVEGIRTTVVTSGGQREEEDMSNNKSEGTCNPFNFQVKRINETRQNRSSSSPDKVKLDFVHTELDPEEPVMRTRDVGSWNARLCRDLVSSSEVRLLKESEGNDSTKKMISTWREHGRSSSCFEEENKNKMESDLRVRPLLKMESTAENDLPTPVSENACGAAVKHVASKFAHKFEKSDLHDKMSPKDTTIEKQVSPTSSKIRKYLMKGKAKALSDGHVNEDVGNEEDDSHESVESCNSAGFFSFGRKRLNFEEQLMVGSKRVKTQVQDSPNSSAAIKRDSSFMNWISNMMKGFSKSNEDESPCLALTLANPNPGSENPHQSLSTCKRNQYYESRTMGFQSIFKSLYSPKTETKGVSLKANDEPEGSKDHGLDNQKCNINATPIACRTGPNSMYRQFLLSNEKLECTTANEAHLTIQPNDLSITVAASQEINESNSTGNKSSMNIVIEKEKDGSSFNSSFGKCKMRSAEDIEPEPSAGEKTNNDFCPSSGLLSSMWITRFTRKTSGSLLELPDKNTGEVAEPPLQNRLGAFIGHKLLDSRENTSEEPIHVQNNASSSDTSFGFYKMKGQHYEKFISKPLPNVSSSRHSESEAMASVFAKRLDALKHVIQMDATDIAPHANTTCFFCGKRGHHLRDCSEVTDNELEDLLRKVTFYNGAGLTCICIRCFQLNHWAASCPNTPLKINSQAECGALLVNECGASEMDLKASNDKIPSMSPGQNNLKKDDCPDSKGKLNEAPSSEDMTLNLRLFERDIATSSRQKLKLNQICSPHAFVDQHIMDVPYQVFDAVNSLRLSRTDILKWMNSLMPVSCLDGFFLRLRLGKWEEGLGGTGYHVACITGLHKKNSLQQSRNSIPVNVGGIRCSVESKYISNQDFQKDELMAWWSATLKGNCKLPSEEDLKQKIREKTMLGF